MQNESRGYLKQEISHEYDDLTIIDYIKNDTDIAYLKQKLAELESNISDEKMDDYGDALNKFLVIDGYNFEENLTNILKRLRFKGNISRKPKTLSGGEKIKVLLVALLLKNSDILLLDEPTNNLDKEAITWLEKYLKNANKKMLIVSHDEEFLNNIVNRIFELNDGEIIEYNLGYPDYLKEKKNEYLSQYEKYTKSKEKVAKLKEQANKAKI